MRDHQREDAAALREDRPENEPENEALLGAGKTLISVVCQSEKQRGNEDDQRLGPGAISKQLAKTVEHESAKDRLFSETRADNYRKQHPGQCSTITDEVLVSLIDGVCAEQRHNDRLHQQLERDAERHADRDTADPAARTDVANVFPWLARLPHPQDHQQRANDRDYSSLRSETSRPRTGKIAFTPASAEPDTAARMPASSPEYRTSPDLPRRW